MTVCIHQPGKIGCKECLKEIQAQKMTELETLAELQRKVINARKELREADEKYQAEWKRLHAKMPELFEAIADD